MLTLEQKLAVLDAAGLTCSAGCILARALASTLDDHQTRLMAELVRHKAEQVTQKLDAVLGNLDDPMDLAAELELVFALDLRSMRAAAMNVDDVVSLARGLVGRRNTPTETLVREVADALTGGDRGRLDRPWPSVRRQRIGETGAGSGGSRAR